MKTPRNYSVIKAFTILKVLGDAEGWLSGCEVSRRANLPQASGYRLIQTMEELGAIARGKRGRYRPGMLLLSISRSVPVLELLRNASEPILTHLAESLAVTVHLAVLEDAMVTYIGKYSSPTAFPSHVRVGARLPACNSGLGKILLAGLTRSEFEALIVDRRLFASTPFTANSSLRFYEELETVRSRGFATDDPKLPAKTQSIAVPFQDRHGKTIAAISASDEISRMTPSREAEIKQALFEAAARSQNALYHSGSPKTSNDRAAAKKQAKPSTAERPDTLSLREPRPGQDHYLAAQSD